MLLNKKTAFIWRFFTSTYRGMLEKAFFLQAADSLGTDLQLDLFTINNYSFGLQIRLPHFFSVALRKAYVIAVLLAFTCNVTYLHIIFS
jgi:hypothetical protein